MTRSLYLFLLVAVLHCTSGYVEGRKLGRSLVKQQVPRTLPNKGSVQAAEVAIQPGGTSSEVASMFNLGKTILGAGVLSLPSGIAAFSATSQGLAPAASILLVMGILSAYSFANIGKVCAKYNARSFPEAWSKAVDPRSSAVLSFIMLFKTFATCLVYSMIIGEQASFPLSVRLCYSN